MLLVEADRCDTATVLKTAAAHTWDGTNTFKAYDDLQEVKDLVDRHPATTAAAPTRPPIPETLVVARRKPSKFSPLAWTVALPAAGGADGVILATDCRTRTRARTIAGWLEDTGYCWTVSRAAIADDDAVVALSTTLCRDLRTAGEGHGLWPEEQLHLYTDLLGALRPSDRTVAPGTDLAPGSAS